MEPSTSETTTSALGHLSLLGWASLCCAIGAALILIWFLAWRPGLGRGTKVLLLIGIGVLPIGAAFTGNIAGYERTMQRDFCGSCHTMTPYTSDAANPFSDSLASLHSRNELFGDRSCYVCHADYGMYGTVSTKLSGMKHVWEYYSEFRDIPAQEALPLIHLYRPYPNANCMQCHSTRIAGWMEVDEHASAVEPIRSGAMSCASFGCHGPSHPFSKPEETP